MAGIGVRIGFIWVMYNWGVASGAQCQWRFGIFAVGLQMAIKLTQVCYLGRREWSAKTARPLTPHCMVFGEHIKDELWVRWGHTDAIFTCRPFAMLPDESIRCVGGSEMSFRGTGYTGYRGTGSVEIWNIRGRASDGNQVNSSLLSGP